MTEQSIDFDRNAPIAGNEYDTMARLALPGYEAMHQMSLACLRANLPAGCQFINCRCWYGNGASKIWSGQF